MKIVRLLSVVCVLSLLAACGSQSITGPDSAEASHSEQPGNGTIGSGG